MEPRKKTKLLPVATAIWILLTITGFWMVMEYQVKPGAIGIPKQNAVALDENKNSWHLVAFLHPECTCSRATLEELEILQRKLGDTLDTRIFISTTESVDETKKSEIYKTASKTKSWLVVIDENADLATQMLAYTSGICYLYSPDEVLVFAGGITASRGHSGPAAGQEIIANAVNGDPSAVASLQQYPVYGCGIQDKSHLVLSSI